MNNRLYAALVFCASSAAQAISNGPLPQYQMNEGCGPDWQIPVGCESEGEKKNYCEGFKGFVQHVSAAGEHIPRDEHVIWCWTIIEKWTECQVPSPKLYEQCQAYAQKQTAPTSAGYCVNYGFKEAKGMYLSDLNRRCELPTY